MEIVNTLFFEGGYREEDDSLESVAVVATLEAGRQGYLLSLVLAAGH